MDTNEFFRKQFIHLKKLLYEDYNLWQKLDYELYVLTEHIHEIPPIIYFQKQEEMKMIIDRMERTYQYAWKCVDRSNQLHLFKIDMEYENEFRNIVTLCSLIDNIIRDKIDKK